METWLVLSNAPDVETARHLANIVVEKRLAACVNILAPCESVYSWEGKIELAQEIPLVIKTTPEDYPALEALLKQEHPYQVPEIIALPIQAGLPAYLDWIHASLKRPKEF